MRHLDKPMHTNCHILDVHYVAVTSLLRMV